MHIAKVKLLADRYPTRGRYPFNVPVLCETGELALDSAVTLLVGENGTGKSTLLEAIACRCGIYIWRGEERGRYEANPYERQLFHFIDVQWTNGSVPGSFFASQIFRHFSQLLDEWASADPGVLSYFGGESLMTKSHGQSLMAYFQSRFRVKGLYLVDEPETALSPARQLELLRLLADMSRDGHAQFIIATHSPILMACPGATIYSFDHVPARPIEYEDTEHFRVYRDFLNDRERFLNSDGEKS
ncbi:MAG TPA: AAA family ATPase [Phycisphaerae bacterium]|nr:AAA family ATPase [Phycisphaerae bacterium]